MDEKPLVAEASKWIGVKETAPNAGPEVEMFQRTVDGKAQKESWCMCFVQYCLHQVETQLGIRSNVFNSEHCLTVFHKTALDLYRPRPESGFIVIWQHGQTAAGHTGIVTRVINDVQFETIEGNTSDSSSVERNGDGVYKKVRLLHPTGEMRIVGFLDPFPESANA